MCLNAGTCERVRTSICGQCLALVTERPRYSVGGKELQASWQLVVLQMASVAKQAEPVAAYAAL